MDGVQVVLWGRTVERLLVVLFSGLSLVLGWNLFRVRLLKDQTAEFTSKGWTIRLERVGPGVFFALFGVVGLIFAVAHPLDIGANSKRGAAVGAAGSEVSEGLEINFSGPEKDAARNELRAINTIEALALPAALPRPNPGEKEALSRAKGVLDMRKAYLLRIEAGDSLARYEKWKKEEETDPAAPSRLSKSESDEFRKVDDLVKGTFLGADK